MDIPKEDYDRIASMISSPDSPVGIDATATHVLIIKKLEEIEKRLMKMERNLDSGRGQGQ